MSLPLVSIITAVYNGSKTLEKCIQSVISQTYSHIEFIIIDGCSTDETINIIKKYGTNVSYWISEPDKGIYDAWNKAIKYSKGEWLCFIGADDFLKKDAIENYVNFINTRNHINFDFISSKLEAVNNDGKVVEIIGEEWDWKKFKKYMNVSHIASLHSKNLFKKYGLFSLNYKIIADYEMLLRPAELLRAGFLNVITAEMTIGGVSGSYLALKEHFHLKRTIQKRNYLLCLYEYIIASFGLFMKNIYR